MTTQFGYGARVFYPIETNPNEGGGPIRRTPLLAVRAHAGNFVRRSPHKMIPDPGRIDEPQLLTQKFLPDGRRVPLHALGGAALPQRARIALYGGLFTFAGSLAGAMLYPEGRVRGAALGGAIGLGASVLGALGGETS